MVVTHAINMDVYLVLILFMPMIKDVIKNALMAHIKTLLQKHASNVPHFV